MESVESTPSFFRRAMPAVSLALLAPILAEILPGATRFSAIFVYPIEVFVWGIGAVLAREVVRRRGLGWASLVLLALVLAIAEEFLIQQTSLAPVVIQLKGVVYARAYGLNYVYALWALVYEVVFVVLLAVTLAELLFPERKGDAWVSRTGFFIALPLFVGGSLLAWFSWTQIARTQVFHQPPYTPPLSAVLLALLAILLSVYLALGPARGVKAAAMRPPAPWILGAGGAIWATLWYGLCLLAFGFEPRFPPAAAVAGGLFLVALPLALLPRFASHSGWCPVHAHAVLFGTMTGAMAVSFIGFLYSPPLDLWFKAIADAVALLWLGWLGLKVRRRTLSTAGTSP